MSIRNGSLFRPKEYIWRSKQTPTWETFLEDLKRTAPPQHGGPVSNIYTLDGNEITEFDQLEVPLTM